MSVITARQTLAILKPTCRAISWLPLGIGTLLALTYVVLEAPGAHIDYKIQVMRLAALLMCVGAAFVLDDGSEETIAHAPFPLIARRAVRLAVVVPVVALSWWLATFLTGEATMKAGGPLPSGDLALEAAALLVIAVAFSSMGARFLSDRLGGIVAGPAVLSLLGISFLVPLPHRLLISSPWDPNWPHSHDLWQWVLSGATVAFVMANWDPGASGPVVRMQRAWRARKDLEPRPTPDPLG